MTLPPAPFENDLPLSQGLHQIFLFDSDNLYGLQRDFRARATYYSCQGPFCGKLAYAAYQFTGSGPSRGVCADSFHVLQDTRRVQRRYVSGLQASSCDGGMKSEIVCTLILRTWERDDTWHV